MVDWINDAILLDQPGSTNDTNQCSIFLDILNDMGLSQHCLEVTRPASNKTLDLILTNQPSVVLDVQSLPGMSDHNIVLSSFKLLVTRNKLPKRKIFKYDKADWDKIRLSTKALVDQYWQRNPDKCSVEENSTFIEKGIEKIIQDEIPSKMSKSKQCYPWITLEVKTIQKRRDRLYIRAKKSRSPTVWNKFKIARQKAKEAIRDSHKSYIKDMVGDTLSDNPKQFWSYIKSLRKDNSSVPTLKTKSGIPAATDNAKANALVNQFSSVFTKENLENIPSLPQEYPDMPDITFGEEGVYKLLNNINANKAGVRTKYQPVSSKKLQRK